MEVAEAYKVELPLFEGPLDLLLHLIKKDDLNIHDIPIAEILGQYLQYLQLAKELNIDLAGEFLEMAAELTLIKSRLLLPQVEEEEEEGPDPRADLVAKLIEYQKYKQAAQALLSRPLLGREVFRREPLFVERTPEEVSIEVDTVKLLSVFQDLLRRLPKEQSHEIKRDRVGVAERILELMEILKKRPEALFDSLFSEDATRSELVVTFLSLLEMARQKLVRIFQESQSGMIVVKPLFQEEELWS